MTVGSEEGGAEGTEEGGVRNPFGSSCRLGSNPFVERRTVRKHLVV